jgi:uncharacterized protein YndB with AHSA1/START domain
MSVVDKTAPRQTEAIAFEVELAHAPAKVWRALTEPALLSKWLLPVTGLTLAPGSAFTLKAQAFPDWDGTVHCQLREIEAQQKLSYSWAVSEMALETLVTFTLTPTSTGCRLSIVQSGFKPAQSRNFGGARYGWKLMGDKLVVLLGDVGP